jgi:hypothetical protein
VEGSGTSLIWIGVMLARGPGSTFDRKAANTARLTMLGVRSVNVLFIELGMSNTAVNRVKDLENAGTSRIARNRPLRLFSNRNRTGAGG